MPREKEQYKYQCKEPGCYLLVRSDKWNNHCKTKHGFKFTSVFHILGYSCCNVFTVLVYRCYSNAVESSSVLNFREFINLMT